MAMDGLLIKGAYKPLLTGKFSVARRLFELNSGAHVHPTGFVLFAMPDSNSSITIVAKQ